MFKELNKNYIILILGIFLITAIILVWQIRDSSAIDLDSGLIGYWKFNSASGRIAYDSSGHNHDAYSHAQYVLWGISGKIDTTTIFYGDRFFTAGDIEEFDFGSSDSFTATAWVKLDKEIKDYRAILGKANVNSKNGYALRHTKNGHLGLLLESSEEEKEINVVSENDYRDGEWHHLVGVVNRLNQTAYLYVDGLLKEKKDISQLGTMVNDCHFNLAGLNNNSVFFQGLIDEARLYNRSLSSLEVRNLFKQENGELPYQFYPAGSLLKARDSYKVYYINSDLEKKWIINKEVFNLYNNQWPDIIKVDSSVLDYYPLVQLMRAQNGQKVYYIKEQTKEWIKTPKEFEQRGFNWHEIDEVLSKELTEYLTVE